MRFIKIWDRAGRPSLIAIENISKIMEIADGTGSNETTIYSQGSVATVAVPLREVEAALEYALTFGPVAVVNPPEAEAAEAGAEAPDALKLLASQEKRIAELLEWQRQVLPVLRAVKVGYNTDMEAYKAAARLLASAAYQEIENAPFM